MEDCVLVSSGSGQGQDTEFLDNDDEIPGEVTDRIFLEWYNEHWLFNKRYV
jgi:hypothetical protein